MSKSLILIFSLLLVSCICQLNMYMVSSTAQQFQPITVITEGETQHQFKSIIFSNPMICTNGMLKLMQWNATRTPSQNQIINFQYNGIDRILTKDDIFITQQPNQQPKPQLIFNSQQQSFTIRSGCLSDKSQITNDNYYNHVTVSLNGDVDGLPQSYRFDFLINCDRQSRHKKFQYGYLLVGLINAAITIGVALHSRIWSIKYDEKPLRIELTWKLFLLIMIILIALGVTLYLVAYKQFKTANQVVKYIGLVVAFVFTFICFNQVLFLFRALKKIIFKTRCYDIRICEIASIVIALIFFIVSLFVQNWLLYTFLAGCICVGSIKMLYFSSMKQAFYSLAISVCSVTIIAIILHFTLPRSYNDYASQLSSPLFIEVPDLVNNLFKKCSWLPVVDIIVPGVLLSFLRTYDENFNTGWGGVYTITGNLSFIFATTLWIGIQALYPFSVPFSLITYTILLVSIVLMAFKRNQLKTLWNGHFLQQREIGSAFLREDDNRKSIKNQLDQETMNAIKIRDSMSSKGDQDQIHELVNDNLQQPFNPKVTKSAFRTKRQTKQEQRISSNAAQKTSKKSNPFTSSIK